MIGRIRGRVGKPVRVEGTAYDFGHSINAIEFSLDEGAHWSRYATEGTNDFQNLAWSFEFTPERSGMYCMLVRSVNDSGQASPESARIELEILE